MASLTPLMTRSITGYNKVQLSLVEDNEAEQFKNSFIVFIKGIEAQKNQQGGNGLQFDYKGSINMKMDAEDLFALGFACQKAAEGQGPNYEKAFGSYSKFADSSRSSYSNGDSAAGTKTLRVGQMLNKDQKTVLSISFNAGGKGGKNIAISLSPYMMFAFSKICYDFAQRILDLESRRGGVAVAKPGAPAAKPQQYQKPAYQKPQQAPQNTFDSEPSFGGIEDSFASGLESAMGGDDMPPPMDAPPF
jgi:hypothetical protein